jgi:tight adherence protein B
MNTISLFFLVSVAIGGIAWVFLYPLLSGEKKAEKRKETVARSTPAVRTAAVAARNTQRSRREQVEG